MDPQKQLNDDGAVIGYSPKLDYNTSVKGNNEVTHKQNDTTESYNGKGEYHTLKLIDFTKHAPSTSIDKLDEIYQRAMDKIEYMSKFFVSSKYDKYNDINLLLAAYTSNNEEYINAFTDFHRYKIKGGTILPEVMTEIFNAAKRLNEVSSICKKLFYGNSDISSNDMASIDIASINKMIALENAGDVAKINYISMTYDSEMCRSLTWYATNLERAIAPLMNTALRQSKSLEYHDTTKASTVERLFDEINEEIDFMRSSYDTYHSTEVLDKTLYNYYNKRKEMLDLFDLSADTDNDTAKRARDNASDNVKNAISNLAKAFLGCHNYISEINRYEGEKRDIISLYDGLSQTI